MRETYGIDAPGVVWTFAVLGAVSTVAIWPAHAAVRAWSPGPVAVVLTAVAVLAALTFWTQCGWMLYGSMVAKRRLWRRTLDSLALRRAGAEEVRLSARDWSMHPPVQVVTAIAPTVRTDRSR